MEKLKKEKMWSNTQIFKKSLLFWMGLFASIGAAFLLNMPLIGTLFLTSFFAFCIFIVFIRNPYGYITSHGTKIIFKNGWIDKQYVEDKIDNIYSIWCHTLKNFSHESILNELRETTIIFDDFSYTYGKKIFIDIESDTKYKLMRYEICSNISKRIFPSLSEQFRKSIMRRYHII